MMISVHLVEVRPSNRDFISQRWNSISIAVVLLLLFFKNILLC